MNDGSRSRCYFEFVPLAAMIAALAALFALPAVAAPDAIAQLRRVDAAFAKADAQDLALLAPTSFSEAVRQYQAAESALKNKQEAQAIAACERASNLLDRAASVAVATRELLREAIGLRISVLELDEGIASRLASGDEILKQAAASAEVGNKNQALANGAKAADAYASVAKQYLKEHWLPGLKKQVKEIPDAPPEDIARA